jgi:ABC-type multidrug transport system fused ATPase/permease subunit
MINEANLEPISYPKLVRLLYKALRPYRRNFWLGSLLRWGSDLTFLFNAYALSRMVDWLATYHAGKDVRTFWLLLGGWAVGYFIIVNIRQLGKYHIYTIAEQVNIDAQRAVLTHLEQLPISWHEHEGSGTKMKRIHNGGEAFEKLLRIWVDNIIEIVTNFVGIIIILSFVNLVIAGIMVGFLLTHILATLPLVRRASEAARAVDRLEEDFSGLAYEVLHNIRTVKVLDIFTRLSRLLEAQANRIMVSITRRVRSYRFKSAMQGNYALLFRIPVLIILALGVMRGSYTITIFALFNFYFTALRQSVEEFSNISEEVTKSRYHVARWLTMMHESVPALGTSAFPKQWEHLELKNVSFFYNPEIPVLKDITLSIKRGQKIGVVGLSGAGKSTLFKLLLKENDHASGEILLGNVPLGTINKHSFYERVAVVLQDTEVFDFSLLDNITMSDTSGGVNRERLERALTVAHVKDFLPRLPQGLDTLIGEKGVKLSGGERQRLGIARAIYKEPEILFLDEATSHLDLESEEKIKDSLHQFFKNVTALVIAHRLTTIQEMDSIVLIENGKISEVGSFPELKAKHGRFLELWEKQRL